MSRSSAILQVSGSSCEAAGGRTLPPASLGPEPLFFPLLTSHSLPPGAWSLPPGEGGSNDAPSTPALREFSRVAGHFHYKKLLWASMAAVPWETHWALCSATEPAAEGTANPFQSKEILKKHLWGSTVHSPRHGPWQYIIHEKTSAHAKVDFKERGGTMPEPSIWRLCHLAIPEVNSRRGGWRECLPPLPLIRGNSASARTGGTSSSLVFQEHFSQLQALARALELLLWHVFWTSPKQVQTQQPLLINAARLKGWNPNHEPREQKVPALRSVQVAVSSSHASRGQGWVAPEQETLWQPLLRALPAEKSTPWPRLLPL